MSVVYLVKLHKTYRALEVTPRIVDHSLSFRNRVPAPRTPLFDTRLCNILDFVWHSRQLMNHDDTRVSVWVAWNMTFVRNAYQVHY